MRKINKIQGKHLFMSFITATAVLITACGQKTEVKESSEPVSQTDTSAAAKQTEVESVKDGIYKKSAKGNNGDVTVEMEIKDGNVIRVDVFGHEETPGISDKPIEEIPRAIVEYQSLGIDAVSGATNTSNAILTAAELCLEEAGADTSEWKNRAVEKVLTENTDAVCDTVVVGAGGAGMKVAIELDKNGQNVILVEKQSMVGGATSLAATYFVAVDTTYHQEAGIELSVDDYISRSMESNPNMNEANLKRLLEGAQESLDWLNAIGTKINRPISDYQLATADGTSLGVAIVQAMSEELERSDVDLRLETEAVDILQEAGEVTGIKVKNDAGEYSILADNIVLATGGFVSGQEAVKEYASDWAGLPSTSAAGSTGEMFKIVDQIGGKLSNMDIVRLNPSVHSENGVNSSLSAARAEGGIIVNQQGLRFCNDYYPDYTVLSKWMMEQEGDFVYILIDQTAMDKSKRLQGFKEKGYFIEADSIEELAKKMDVPEENLKQTIEKYQKAVETGVDEEFGREHNLSIDFTHAPFYAVTTCPGLQVSLGGILVNENMQIEKNDGTEFDNLYAVGECADDGLFGSGPTNINITFGKLVAEHILAK